MNFCRETAKMTVPARHREPARSGEAGGHGISVVAVTPGREFMKYPG